MENLREKVDLEKYKYKNMYNRFIKEKTPSVCVTGSLNISNIYKLKKKHKLNALLCFLIMKTGEEIEEFHYSIKEDGLYFYKHVKVNAVINGKDDELYYSGYDYCDNFFDFEKKYIKNNQFCYENCTSLSEDTGALLSTSAMIQYPFESIVLNLSDEFWDNFFMWGAYKHSLFKTKLNITLRFHHATIGGQRAALFFKKLQENINNFNLKDYKPSKNA